ncbi:hypothetical protein [Rhizobium tubonense]|uniref:Uncharacterized protein n=1 Tax=Rhizobium tubonense TaxID=484088 RepID=A0A2W4C3E3_9HYPH|nr:hypothetical protein [Rhizobium tubonense]PZM07581.1 hypothetical protein CPY51_31110 [Rhizobium tubonense]
MADNTPALPPGFVLSNTAVHDDTPPLPAGFQLFPASRPGSHPGLEESQKLLDAEDQQKSMAGANGAVGAGLTGFANGIPIVGPAVLGGLQRAAAGIASVIDGEPYADKLKQAQDITAQAGADHPYVEAGGEIAGNIAGTAPLVAAAPAAFGVSAASVPARAIASATTNGVIGAADGYARNGGEGAAWGGGVGAVAGFAAPYVGHLIGEAYRGIRTAATQGEAARLAGTSRPAVDVAARALAADNATGATNANIAAAGQHAMLADAGPATQSVLDTAIARAGPGAGEAANRITARAEQASRDINNALDTSLGNPQGMVAPLTAIRDASLPARTAAYDAAYAAPIDYADPRGRTLENLIRTRVPPPIVARANNLMRVNGEQSQQMLARVADDGTVTYERLPDVRQIDYITRALNDVSRRGDGNGILGGNTSEGFAYGNLARTLRNATAALVPEYRTALDTAADPANAREAALFGQHILSPTVPRDEVEAFVSGLSNPELQHLRGGIRAKFAETIANVKRTVADPNTDARQGIAALRDLSSDAARQKLAYVLGPREAVNMFDTIDRAATAFQLRANVSTNSRTYARQAAERAVDTATSPSMVQNAASGKPIVTAQGFLKSLAGTDDASMLARKDETWRDVANLMTMPANTAQGSFLQALQGAAAQLPTIDRNTGRIVAGVTRGLSGGLVPQASRLSAGERQ